MAQQQMSLFGPSVYDIQRQQMQQDQANAIQQAQLSPYQGIAAAAAMAGTRAGRSLAGLFGIEDPALSEAKKMEELKAAVASQWDGNDPLEAYKIFAKEASARGLTQAAIGAATQIKAFEAERETSGLRSRLLQAQIGKTGAQQTKEEALAEKARKEQEVKLFGNVDPAKFTPESLEAFKQSRNYKDLVPVDSTKYSDVYQIPGADGRPMAVQRNLKTNQIEPVDKASRVNVNASANMPPQEVEFQKQIGQEDAKAVVKARELRTTAIGELSSLNEMATRNQQNITSGTFASGRVGVANFFNTIGLLGANDVQKLANSEVYTKSAGDLVLAKIKSLGSNPSNADREFIVRIVPQLENSPQARAELISYLQKRANDVIKESNALETYARQNKGLSGYVPTIPLTISPQTAKKASDMTDQELIDAYKSGRR
jgi:hypothetical protein